jgi:type IX secretion system PorP/SprF family membrane protein
MLKWLLLFATFICHLSIVHSQDIHFSHFNFSPLNQNPANTNLFNADYRFVANYKNQWPTVPVKFNTFSASAEMNFVTLSNNDRVGGGLLFYFDRVGDSRFTTLNTALSFSYTYNFGKRSEYALVYGIQFGMANKSFNYANLNFDNQWNGDVFNANIPADESYSNTHINYFDLGTGLAYRWDKNERTNVTVGFSVMHLNQPRQTFYTDNSVKLNPRFTLHTRGQVKVAKRVDIVPEAMWQMQDTKQEFVLGAHAKYYMPVKIPHTIALNIGAYGRIVDAGWLFAGVDFDNLQVNLSYDINLTALKAASRYNGGLELSVIYILAKVKNISKPVCPAFL